MIFVVSMKDWLIAILWSRQTEGKLQALVPTLNQGWTYGAVLQKAAKLIRQLQNSSTPKEIQIDRSDIYKINS